MARRESPSLHRLLPPEKKTKHILIFLLLRSNNTITMSSKARSGHAIELNSTSNSAKLRKTCDACQAIKTRCSRDRPSCVRCQSQNIPCHYSVSRRIGRPRRLIPPPSPILRSNGRQLEEPIQATQLYSVNWSGVDAEVESPRIMVGV